MKPEDFRKFVKEAYIDPLRSVLIVDDDYPTFDEILSLKETDKKWRGSPESAAAVNNVISQFRQEHQPMMVDIHDGQNVSFGDEERSVFHLHQSDLLVLDYELEKGQKDGSRAISIARNILANNHFNLILVHTREDLEAVFINMLISLISGPVGLVSDAEEVKAREMIENAELEKENIFQLLKDSVDVSHYLYVRSTLGEDRKKRYADQPSFSAIEALCDEVGWTGAADKEVIKKWALSEFQKTIEASFNSRGDADLTWTPQPPYWIRSNSGFVAFTNKADEEAPGLVDRILDALCDWAPQPSRLFLVKLRAEIESAGVIAEDKALGTRHAHAKWYQRLLDSKSGQMQFLLTETLTRSSEKLLSSVLPGISKYSSGLVAAEDAEASSTAIVKQRFSVDLSNSVDSDRARNEHNVFVCSKEVEGFHLAPGHILESEGHYWICLTPACDLVPGQKKSGRFEGVGEFLHFTAVRLQVVQQPNDGVKKKTKESFAKTYDRALNSGRFMLVEIDDNLVTLSLNAPLDENSSPHWFSLFAADQGKFDLDSKNLIFAKPEADAEAGLTTKQYNARVVAQLRYEYALNLMQKLGVSMTRIGLDFL